MAGQTILIVEDDPDIRDGVRILLAGEGYHILEAENGLRHWNCSTRRWILSFWTS